MNHHDTVAPNAGLHPTRATDTELVQFSSSLAYVHRLRHEHESIADPNCSFARLIDAKRAVNAIVEEMRVRDPELYRQMVPFRDLCARAAMIQLDANRAVSREDLELARRRLRSALEQMAGAAAKYVVGSAPDVEGRIERTLSYDDTEVAPAPEGPPTTSAEITLIREQLATLQRILDASLRQRLEDEERFAATIRDLTERHERALAEFEAERARARIEIARSMEEVELSNARAAAAEARAEHLEQDVANLRERVASVTAARMAAEQALAENSSTLVQVHGEDASHLPGNQQDESIRQEETVSLRVGGVDEDTLIRAAAVRRSIARGRG